MPVDDMTESALYHVFIQILIHFLNCLRTGCGHDRLQLLVSLLVHQQVMRYMLFPVDPTNLMPVVDRHCSLLLQMGS